MGLLALLTLMVIGVQPARAGTWMLVSCANPDGSVAPTDGWSAFTQGTTTLGDGNNTHCSAGAPMSASLGNQIAAQPNQSETLEFQSPAGSALIGGTLNVAMSAYGGDTKGGTAQADVLEPQDNLDQSDAVFACINSFGCGGNSGNAYAGPVVIPANRGGNLFVTAICTVFPGFQCDQNVGGSDGYWARAQVNAAHLLLSNAAAPQGTAFSGSALQPHARGVAHLVFTATDAGGPGIYAVTAAIDGGAVFSGTPNTNDGACVPVGADPGTGALMFDSQQPCPATEVVDIPVPTTGLPDGSHELSVTVTDAARNSSTVLDQTITTSNPQTTPNPTGRGALHARFVISWSWNGSTTLLRRIRVSHLPRNARVSVRCAGMHCPRLRASAIGPRRVATLLTRLAGRRLRAGQSLLITVAARRHRPERIEVRIRSGRMPLARLVK